MSVLTPQEPPLWKALARHWVGLDDRTGWLWWAALHRARWSHAAAFLMALRDCDGLAAALDAHTVYAFMEAHAQPQHLVELIERLYQEKLLTRRESSQLQQQVLAHVDRRGEWIAREGRISV
jgi:hypothetical protein